MQFLDLSHNWFGYTSSQAIENIGLSIAGMASLQHFDIANNWVGSHEETSTQSVDTLISNLADSATLETVNLSNNRMEYTSALQNFISEHNGTGNFSLTLIIVLTTS